MQQRGKSAFENTGRPSGHGLRSKSEADQVMSKISEGFCEDFQRLFSE